MSGTRIESDSIGEIEVPAAAYWGAQTERSRHNFAFPPHERMPLPIIHALARIKGAAARVNRNHGLDAGLAEFVEMDHRISPHLRLTPSTGHTPGHVSVMTESNGESAVITGDMSHHPCQMAHLVAALRQRSESGGSDARATVRRMGRQTHSGDRHSLLGADGGIHNAGGRRVPLRRRGDGRPRCLTSGEDDNLEKEHRIELNG